MDACRYQIENERPVQAQQLVCATPPSDEIRLSRCFSISLKKLFIMVYFSQSAIEGYEKQIHQFQLKLSQNDEERSLLRERLNEVELELRKVLDDHTSTIAMHEEQLQSLVIERDALVEEHALRSVDK